MVREFRTAMSIVAGIVLSAVGAIIVFFPDSMSGELRRTWEILGALALFVSGVTLAIGIDSGDARRQLNLPLGKSS